MDAQSGFTYLLDFVITWTIGLAPIFILRYVIIKEPVDKWTAIVTSVLYFFGYVLFWISMDVQSPNNFLAYLFALICYAQLRRPNKSDEDQDREDAPPDKNKE